MMIMIQRLFRQLWMLDHFSESILFLVILVLEILECTGEIKTNRKRGEGQERNSCSHVRVAWTANGLGNNQQVPLTTLPGDNLQLCSHGRTCCTPAMVDKLKAASREDFIKISTENLASTRQNFIMSSSRFETFCLQLIDNSTKDLHDMFQKTYGLLYLQNSRIFTDLFRQFRSYYRGRDLNLLDVLENFFSVLFQRMFALLNTSYVFDDRYLRCVADNMDQLKPFSDVPQKLSIHLRRAFIAARTFLQGLIIGRNTIFAISKIDPTESCNVALTKMLYCPYCKGLIGTKPCRDYCTNVMKGCLLYHIQLQDIWNSYIESMLRVADRLEGPFNIESVIEPMNVKISDAIMNFQENSEVVTSKVFQECGQPALGTVRRKRQTRHSSHQTHVQPSTATTTTTMISHELHEIRKVLVSSRNIWTQLSFSSCASISAPLIHENKCWNGQSKSRYMVDIIDDDVDSLSNNPEVAVDVEKPNLVVEQQLLQLKLITNRLQNAYSGLDVEWMDTVDKNEDDDDEDNEESGSGVAFLPADHDHSYDAISVTISTIRYVDHPTRRISALERSRATIRPKARSISVNSKPLTCLVLISVYLVWTLCNSL